MISSAADNPAADSRRSSVSPSPPHGPVRRSYFSLFFDIWVLGLDSKRGNFWVLSLCYWNFSFMSQKREFFMVSLNCFYIHWSKLWANQILSFYLYVQVLTYGNLLIFISSWSFFFLHERDFYIWELMEFLFPKLKLHEGSNEFVTLSPSHLWFVTTFFR